MTNLGPEKYYLPVQAPLLDYLTVETKGPTGWKYPKLQELRRFQQKQGFVAATTTTTFTASCLQSWARNPTWQVSRQNKPR